MRIAYDFQAFSQVYGGVALYYSRLIEHLNFPTANACIFSPIFQNKFIAALPPGKVLGMYLPQYPPKSKRVIWQINRFYGALKMQAWKPDIYHQTYYDDSPLLKGDAVRVLTVYDMIHEQFPSSFLKNDRTSFLKKKAVERADHIVCISDHTKNDLVRLLGVDEKKITRIYLGVDWDNQLYDFPLIGVLKSRPYILYVGARTKYKNFSMLLEAYAKSLILSKDFDLVALGGGSFTVDELQIIKELNIPLQKLHRVNADSSQINAYYQHAVALVYPSLCEGFGLPPLEAMTNGCPVISSNSGSMPEICGSAVEYFSPQDVGSMIQSIESVVYSPSRVKQLKILGYAHSKNYSWGRCAQETWDLYQKLI